jgi:hypothetical protein
MYPQTMEVRPPMIKATVVYGNETDDGSAVKNKRKAKAIINPNRKVYSCLRKVIAPYLIILS